MGGAEMKKEVWKKVVAGAGIILALGVGAGCEGTKGGGGTGKVRIVGTSNQGQLQQK
jgi:hypothetical protein